jgi:serine/threonine protein kinase
MRVTNGIPLGCPLPLTVTTVKSVQTLKDLLGLLRGFRARKSTIEISEAIHICMDVARGLEHMADCRLVHCDIAARNVLVDKGNVMKVADFGLTRVYNEGKLSHTMLNPSKMPIKWCVFSSLFYPLLPLSLSLSPSSPLFAIECSEPQKFPGHSPCSLPLHHAFRSYHYRVAIEGLRKPEFSEATDMWSFGVMCWEVLTLGASPYIGVTIKEMYVKLLEGMRLEMPPSCPQDVWEVFETCWMQDPKARLSFNVLIEAFAKLAKTNKKYVFQNKRDLGATVMTIKEEPDTEFAEFVPTAPSTYSAVTSSLVAQRRGSTTKLPTCAYKGANGNCVTVIDVSKGVAFCDHHLCRNPTCKKSKSSREQFCGDCARKAMKEGGRSGSTASDVGRPRIESKTSASSMGFGGGPMAQMRASKSIGGGF